MIASNREVLGDTQPKLISVHISTSIFMLYLATRMFDNEHFHVAR